MKKQLKADLSLLFVTIMWGSTFVVTKNALADISVYNFLAIRFLIAFAFGYIIFYKNMKNINKDVLKYGFLIGFILFLAYATQTVGLLYTSASKSGFITGFSVVIVPLIISIISKQIPKKEIVIGVLFAIGGLAFLSLDSSSNLNIGDFYTLLCAFAYAMHIIAVGHFTHKVDSICLAVVQIGVVGILSLIFTFIFESPSIPTAPYTWMCILLTGIVCTTGAFVIQNVMQKYTSATHTALIYTTEPVFSAIFAYLLAGEIITTKGYIGCALILLGMLIAEVDIKSLFFKSKIDSYDIKEKI